MDEPKVVSPEVTPLGECALLLRCGNAIDAQLNHRVVEFARHLNLRPVEGMFEAAPAYCSVVVRYDAAATFDRMRERMLERWRGFSPTEMASGRLWEIPVRYGGEDLQAIGEATGFGAQGVIDLHAAKEYRVYLMGFLPGFAYLGEVDERIAAPRRATPRLRVAAGSVGIAGRQTGVYPMDSPGGWQIIGHTETRMFDPTASEPVLLSAGDRVRFVAI